MKKNKMAFYASLLTVLLVGALFLTFFISSSSFRPDNIIIKPQPGDTGTIEDPSQITPVTPLDVDTENIQQVVDALVKPGNFKIELETTVYHSAGQTIYKRECLTLDGHSRINVYDTNRALEKVYIYSPTAAYVWRAGSRTYKTLQTSSFEAEDSLFMPNYTHLRDFKEKTQASLTELEGVPCLFVEIKNDLADTTVKYWLAIETGFLLQSQTVRGDKVVIETKITASTVGAAAPEDFELPDGKQVYQAG